MARPREQIDMWLLLTNPFEARRFIHEFDWNLPLEDRPDRVIIDTDRVILFDKMDDNDAVVAAMEILRSVQIPLEMQEKQIKDDLGEIH